LAAFVRQTGREPANPAVVLGAPAKVVRKLSKEERAGLKWWAEKYVDNGAYCLKHGISVGGRRTASQPDGRASQSRRQGVAGRRSPSQPDGSPSQIVGQAAPSGGRLSPTGKWRRRQAGSTFHAFFRFAEAVGEVGQQLFLLLITPPLIQGFLSAA
jgi:hypothetical protein